MTVPTRGRQDLPGVPLLPAVTLDELAGVADLQRRFERKHLVGEEMLAPMVKALGPRFRVLEVEGRRQTRYTSVYFDTPDLRSYRDHLQRRRQRYKVRTRHYGEPMAAMLEVKCRGRRGQTVKHRWRHPGASPSELGAQAERLVDMALREQYGFALPGGLGPRVVTRFERITLIDLEHVERLTIDRGLSVESNGRRIDLGGSHAVVETKALHRRSTASAVLASLGIRPVGVSKYCVGIAASHDDVRGNAWLPVLRLVRPPVSLSSG